MASFPAQRSSLYQRKLLQSYNVIDYVIKQVNPQRRNHAQDEIT